MNRAPTVYIPTEPEGNGIALPLLLSVLAHAIVMGILFYAYQSPTLETEGSIETVMVSPEQLADMQAQILANRAASAAASEAGDVSATPPTDMPPPITDTTNPAEQSEQATVFLPSDDAPDEPLLMSESYQARVQAESQAYQDNLAQWNAEQEDLSLDRLEQAESQKQNRLSEEREQLRVLKDKQNNPPPNNPLQNKSPTSPRVEKPNSTQRNIEITKGSAGGNKNLSLSEDGQSTFAGDSVTSSPNKGANQSASAARGASNSEIISLIRRNYQPPVAAKGATQRATLTITINSSGKVTNVTAVGSDPAVNEAARRAVLATGSFPIAVGDPKYPTFSVQFNGRN